MYTTRAQVLRKLKQPDNNITENTQIFECVMQAMNLIDRYTHRKFAPFKDVRGFSAATSPNGGDMLGDTLQLDYQLITLDSLTVDGETLTSEDYQLINNVRGSYDQILLKDSSWRNVTYPDGAIVVNGVWGYMRHEDAGWKSVDTLQSDIDTTITTLSVADVDGIGWNGLTPRISAGNLLRIGDEYMMVTDTASEANTVDVVRGYRGTTSASHSTNDIVQIWQAEPDIEYCATRWAQFLYKRASELSRTEIDGVGQVTIYGNMPPDIEGTLNFYRRMLWRSV